MSNLFMLDKPSFAKASESKNLPKGRPAKLLCRYTHNAANLSPQANCFLLRFVCFIVIISVAKITGSLLPPKIQ